MKALHDTGVDSRRLRFGEFVLDLRRAELTLGGQPVPLRPKALALLEVLVAQAGGAISKEELRAAVWPGVVVSDDSLTQCVAELRTALGDRGGQSIVHTLPRLGYRFDVPVCVEAEPEASISPQSQPQPQPQPQPGPALAKRPAHWRWALLAGLGAAVVAAGAGVGLRFWQDPPAPARIDAELMARRSVAVMPFADRSMAPAPHIAEAVVEEIVTDVARMGDVRVIASGTTRALAARGQSDPVQVGRELGVQFVLTGSVLRAQDQLQVQVQLSRADSGALVWSQRFDYADDSGWRWRGDVAARIAGTLDVKLHEGALDASRHADRSSRAMEQWMRGQHLLRHYKTHKDVLQARAHFEAALAAEPRSVNALIGMAKSHHAEVLRRWRIGPERDESLQRAREYARAALAIEPNHAGAVATLGVVLSFANEFDEAEHVLTRALALNPNDADAHRDLGGLMYFMGRFSEIRPHIEASLRLNPLDPVNLWQNHMILGDSLMHQGLEEAREHHQLALLAEPTLPNPYFSMASHAARAGRIEEARMHMANARRLSPDWSISRSRAADRSRHPAYLAAREHYREGLRLAGLPEGPADGGPLVPADAPPATRR